MKRKTKRTWRWRSLQKWKNARVLRAPVRPTLGMVERREVGHVPYRPCMVQLFRERTRTEWHIVEWTHIMSNYRQFRQITRSSAHQSDPHTNSPYLPSKIAGFSVFGHIQLHPTGTENIVGDRRMVLKWDQEPLTSPKGICCGSFSEAAPMEGHEKCNGQAEGTVKQVAGLVRTLREHVQFYAGVEVPATHSIMAWIVEHAGTVLSFCPRRCDGLTPYNRVKRLRWRRLENARSSASAPNTNSKHAGGQVCSWE